MFSCQLGIRPDNFFNTQYMYIQKRLLVVASLVISLWYTLTGHVKARLLQAQIQEVWY